MKKSLLKIYALVALVVGLVAISFVAGLYLGDNAENNSHSISLGSKDEVDMSLFWRVWDLLEEKHVSPTSTTTDDVKEQDKIFAAIQGLTDSYDDPYTIFLPPQEAKVFEETVNGQFGGIGIEVGMRDENITVISPLKDTPADRAGLRAGDVIVAVDGNSIANKSVEEVVEIIRGEIGTEVVLTIARSGRTLEVPIVRDEIRVPAMETEQVDDVFVIHFYNFSAVSPGQFRVALREFIKAKTDKLIIDLRGNPGGFLEASIDIASWFMSEGEVIVRQDRGTEEDQLYRSKGYDIFTDNLKLAVLINNGSASASEILAGALQEQVGATLIGESTFGKGSVQELISLADDTSLKVTVARWLTPNGQSISDGGLHPDIEVELDEELFNQGTDTQLNRAIEFLQNL